MNNTLSINRIGLLLKRFFIQNLRKDMRLMGAAIACSIFLHFVRIPAVVGPFTPVIFWLCLYMAGTIYKLFADRNHGLMYTMLPASTLEKAVVSILIVSVYYVILAFFAEFIGCILGEIIRYLVMIGMNGFAEANLNFDITFQDHLAMSLLILAMVQSIFLFGSIYFRKHAIVKTILVGLGLLFALVLVIVIIAATFMDTETRYTYSPIFYGDATCISIIIISLITLFFWGMSYLRLRETEV